MSPTDDFPPRWRSEGLWPARSRAEVRFLLGERGEVRRAARRLFGRPLCGWEYAGLAGAPDDARVELGTWRDQLYIETSDPVANRYRAHLNAGRVGADLVIVNEGLQIHFARMQKKGLGLRIFHRQLHGAVALGASRIEAVAGRRHDENGYYTWPRFGFDGPLPERIKRDLPLGLDDARTVLDLMECERGRLWWQEHGCTIRVTFDLFAHSRSRKAFTRYLREKLGQKGAGRVAV